MKRDYVITREPKFISASFTRVKYKQGQVHNLLFSV